MINKRNVRLMTRMAVYEERDGVRDRRMNAYYRADYCSSQCLRTFVCSTIAFVLICMIAGLCNFESLMLDIYSMNVQDFLMQMVLYYLVFLIIMEAVTVAAALYRTKNARYRLNGYYRNLRKLYDSYKRKEDE